MAKMVTVYARHGNLTEASFFGPDGLPVAPPSLGLARVVRTFDARGKLLTVQRFDAKGNLIKPASTPR
jgi:hypothetical protein